ncbi:type IV pilus assembly protein PilM [bacterium]|nr:type IV pilus assembly protein PilM [bacterium]
MDFLGKFFKQLFNKEREEFYGIDVGSSTIKIVSIAKSGKGFEFTRCAVCPTPPATVKNGSVVDAQSLSDVIREILKDNGFPVDSRVVASVSGQSVIVRPIHMPKMSSKELKSAIKYQADNYLPYSPDDALIDGIIIRDTLPEEPNQMEVLFVAAPQEILTNTRELIELAGATVESVDLEPFAILRALNESNPELCASDKNIAVVNLGASFGSISVFKNGTLRLSRTISVAGNDFTKALGKELNLSFEEAEKFKIEKCVVLVGENSEPVSPTTQRAFKYILPVLEELGKDIKRSIDYYQSRKQDESVDVIILSGGAARLKNIDVYLSDKLNIECHIANPFKNISIANVQNVAAGELEVLAPMVMVAAGLALRKVNA